MLVVQIMYMFLENTDYSLVYIIGNHDRIDLIIFGN